MYYAVIIYQYYIHIPFEGVVEDANNIPINNDIWAFAYKEDERALNLMCKPVRGRIKNDKYFYEYKVNGKDLKKNGVSLYARYFADTEKEAIKGFNALLNKRINSLTEEIDKLENMLIE